MLGQEQDCLGGGLVSGESFKGTSTYGKECLQPMKSNCCPGLAKPRGLETCTSGRTFCMA